MLYPDQPPRRAWVCSAIALLALGVGGLRPAAAQAPGADGVYYSKQLNFRIPFSTDPNDRRIREVQLYQSDEQNPAWKQVASSPPPERPNDKPSFPVVVPREGWYSFTVRTVDLDNRAHPAVIEQAQTKLKVCVDTKPPVVSLRPSATPAGAVSVDYDVKDDNLDVAGLQLDYRIPGAAEWIPVGVGKQASGSRAWNPATNANLEVRLVARDLAGNVGEATTAVSPTGKPTGGPPDTGTGNKPPDPASPGGARVVGSKKISLDYEVVEVGKSGLAVVELWWTRGDARSWTKYIEQANPTPPFTFEVTEEGLYGFTLVARNNAGLGEPPPKAGDQPQTWVEVDLTKPLVQLRGVDVGRGTELGTLTITWSASDKNIARKPISLSYAESLDGPWQTIVQEEENSGRYVWRMPENVPFKLHVRVEAVDVAGNVASSDLTKPVIVDMSQPKVKVRNVVPGGK